MVNFLAMPEYKVFNPFDTTPIYNALDTNQRLGQQQRQFDATNKLQQAQLGLAQNADRRAQVQSDAQSEDRRRQQAGALAQMGLVEKDPTRRMNILRRIHSMHADPSSLGPEYQNPDTAFDLIVREAQGFMGQEDSAKIDLMRAQTGLANAQAAEFRRKAAMPAGGFKDAKQLSDVEEGMRKEYSSHAKPYFEVRDAFTRIQQATANPSPAGDLALIFNFMKMLDPGSVVREGEFATAQNAAGVPDRVVNLYNRMLSGERLNPSQRQDFVSQAQGLYSRAETQYGSTQGQYRALAERKGIDPRNVILDYSIPKTQQERLPQDGMSHPTRDLPRTDRQAMPSRTGGGQGMIPLGAVQFLRSNPSPEIIQQFETKYGTGAARQFLGAP